jgi:iron complex transport system permease protein
VIAASSLGTAAIVSAVGLIGFVGIIVPHIVRLLVGTSYRRILPISVPSARPSSSSPTPSRAP